MADDPQIVHEHNLQKSLGKKFFRLPPVQSSAGKGPAKFANKNNDRNYLGATLFPIGLFVRRVKLSIQAGTGTMRSDNQVDSVPNVPMAPTKFIQCRHGLY